MPGFLLLVWTRADAPSSLSPAAIESHIRKLRGFIESKTAEGSLLIARPLELNGITIVRRNGELLQSPLDLDSEIVSSYYLIEAEDMAAAAAFGKSDPRFESSDWKIEVRPILEPGLKI